MKRISKVAIILWTTAMMAVLSSARAELCTENSLSELFCLCRRLGPKMVAKFSDVILFPVICNMTRRVSAVFEYLNQKQPKREGSRVTLLILEALPTPAYLNSFCLVGLNKFNYSVAGDGKIMEV